MGKQLKVSCSQPCWAIPGKLVEFLNFFLPVFCPKEVKYNSLVWPILIIHKKYDAQNFANDDSRLISNKEKQNMRSSYGQRCYFKYQHLKFNMEISYLLFLKLLNGNNSPYPTGKPHSIQIWRHEYIWVLFKTQISWIIYRSKYWYCQVLHFFSLKAF